LPYCWPHTSHALNRKYCWAATSRVLPTTHRGLGPGMCRSLCLAAGKNPSMMTCKRAAAASGA
jgi:hypothetical protein